RTSIRSRTSSPRRSARRWSTRSTARASRSRSSTKRPPRWTRSSRTRVRRRTYMDRQRRAGLFFVLPALAYFALVFLVPLVESLIGSFYRMVPGGATQYVGLRLYEKVLTDPTFWQAVRNTVGLLILSVPVTVALALAVALGLHR